MRTIRDSNGGISFKKELKDIDQIRLLNRIDKLEKEVKQLKEELFTLKVGFSNVNK